MTNTDPTERSAHLEIRNRLGLHARAATLFVKTASGFDAKIEVGKDGRWVDGKGILGLMTLEAPHGSRIEVRASGAEAAEALAAIVALVERRFDEAD